MVWWHALAYVMINASFLSYLWFSCKNAEDPAVRNHAAVVKFSAFAADVRAAASCSRDGIRLVPCWNGFHGYECTSTGEPMGGISRTYVLDFTAIGFDGREVCLSCTDPAWSVLSACAGQRGLALLTAEARVRAQYAT